MQDASLDNASEFQIVSYTQQQYKRQLNTRNHATFTKAATENVFFK